jgi:hypothetical protein
MTLTLVSSGDGPALMIRDHLLPLVREHGALEIQRDAVRLIALRKDAWVIEHWTPFNELSREEASSPSYRHALERKVLSILWADDGAFKVIDFARGPWENEALAL